MNRKIVSIIAIAGIVIVSFLLMGFLAKLKKDPPKTPPKEITIHVKASKVKYDTLRANVYGTGRVNSKQDIDLTSEVQGKLLSLNFDLKKGADFKKGDLLVKIYNKDSEYNLKSRKSRFLNSIAGILPDFKIDFSDSYNTWLAFFESIELDKDLPDLPELGNGQEKIFLASRNILGDYYTIKGEEIRLKKYSIYAPFNGSIGDVYLEKGSVANPGSKIAKLIRTDNLELEVPLETEDAIWVNYNDEVKIVDTKNGKEFKGKVVRKTNYVDEKSQSISVFIALKPTRGNPIFKGQYLQAHFEGRKLYNVMEMPRNSVVNSNQVFIVKDGHLAKMNIDVVKVNTKTLFFKGLEEGDELVIEPLLNVKENTKVEILR